MSAFLTTVIWVAIMLAYAVPGFLVVKTKMVKATAIRRSCSRIWASSSES